MFQRSAKLWTAVTLVLISAPTASAAQESEPFPLRREFPTVQTISLESLHQRLDDVIVVDARPRIEFNIVHIVGAHSIDDAQPNFEKTLAEVRPQSGRQTIVFYCNGHTCHKSYDATVRAQNAGFGNVLCYDGGINDWLLAHPEHTVLLGVSPADTSKLIPPEELEGRTIGLAEFLEKARADNAVVIDIREPYYQQPVPALGDAMRMSQLHGSRLLSVVRSGAIKNRRLLIFDTSGLEVQWLQYDLERSGYKDYWFLRGGADGNGARTIPSQAK